MACSAETPNDESLERGTKPAGRVEAVEVTFARGHRRDRPNVHFPGHPDSDTVYRITITATVTPPAARVKRILLTRGTVEEVLEVRGERSGVVTPVTIVDDQAAPPADFDGDYDLVVEVAGGERFRQSFTAEGMNSLSTPQILTPSDCEVMADDQPAFSWAPSMPQPDEVVDAQAQHLELISHADVSPTSLSTALPVTTTRFKVGGEHRDPTLLQHLGDGPYRVVVTEIYRRNLGRLRLIRASWNARAFVIGNNVECD
jgi:hypothetical protein